jgi:FtsZ-interacting cell division protein YlmF
LPGFFFGCAANAARPGGQQGPRRQAREKERKEEEKERRERQEKKNLWSKMMRKSVVGSFVQSSVLIHRFIQRGKEKDSFFFFSLFFFFFLF